WLGAVIPPQGEKFDVAVANIGAPTDPVFSAGYTRPAATLAPGQSITIVSYRYAGAKDVDILRSYQAPKEKGGLGIVGFDRAIDWGNFWMLTRPIFATLDFLGDSIGNWGLAILVLTIVMRLLVFPFANGAFEMTAKMKKAQPQMEALKTQYGNDPTKMQQEMMALYKKEKINPVTGCLPILLQIPIFYALYKTLFVTIELRHQPFFGFIRDLAAPDPTNLFNLFGLLPYDPTSIPLIGSVLHIGLLPLLYGVAMWFQMKLNPPAQDPIQQQIFAIMPWMMVFLFAPFAAGLVIYWIWSTVISIFQQFYFMKKHKVEIDWKANFRPPWSKAKTPATAKPGPVAAGK
ncbi:MAG: membrane protein insertase YidC, partial [Parvularculaceae bacterium]|nr:membrane protein insertase YidC [Parvularculaceae bacterium]